MRCVLLADGKARIAYSLRGEGPTLTLIRPLGGNMTSWDRFAETLARHTRLLVFDARGSGWSTACPLHTTTREMADDLRQLLDALHIERTHVYGISLGGMVASWFAIGNPQRVERLVLASTLAHGFPHGLEAWPKLTSLALCLLRRPEEAERCMATHILDPKFRASNPCRTRRAGERAQAGAPSRRGLVAHLGAAMTHDARAHLHEIQVPTLVLEGERDPLVNNESERELLRPIPDVTFHMLPGAGHDLSAEQPEVTAQRVLEHLGIV